MNVDYRQVGVTINVEKRNTNIKREKGFSFSPTDRYAPVPMLNAYQNKNEINNTINNNRNRRKGHGDDTLTNK